MSLLPQDVHTALNQLLQGLQSADNTTRSAAEESLNNDWVTARPEVLLMGLVEHLQAAEDANVRHFSRDRALFSIYSLLMHLYSLDLLLPCSLEE